MALNDPYVTASELKTRLGITDANDDTAVTDAVNGASRWIEKYCGRQFNDAASASAREFYPRTCHVATVHDFNTTTGLVIKTDNGDDGTFETTWSTTDYQLEPLNGISDGETGWPYYTIRVRTTGANLFPMTGTGAPLQVTARWGWTAVPAAVKSAAYILAAEAFKLKDTFAGAGGFNEYGPVLVRRNPQAVDLLKPYRANPILVG